MTMQRDMDGVYSALLEGRFFFDFVHEDRLELERLTKYAALILPNIALLSDEQCAQLRAYVEQGGSLLATFETSMYSNQNHRRGDFGLADVFGIHAAGPVIGRRGNSNPFYARIERQHPILEGFTDTNWLPGAEYRLPVVAVENPVLTVVPGFVAYPPELSYPPVRQTTEGNTDLSRLLQNTIRWVGGDGAPVRVEGTGLIEAFAWETEPGFAVHVLNYTNPNTHRGWLREFYPIGKQKVRLELPAGRRVLRIELLRAEKEIPFHRNGAAVEFTIPSVEDYEIAALIAG